MAIELVHVRCKLNENREHETIVSVVYRKWHTRRGGQEVPVDRKKCKKTRENFRGHALRALHGSKIDRPKKVTHDKRHAMGTGCVFVCFDATPADRK